jgi:hypothetical protein
MIRAVGGVLGSVLGASAMSVYQIKDTTLDFGNYTRHVATPAGLFGAVIGGFAGAYPDVFLKLIFTTGDLPESMR